METIIVIKDTFDTHYIPAQHVRSVTETNLGDIEVLYMDGVKNTYTFAKVTKIIEGGKE